MCDCDVCFTVQLWDGLRLFCSVLGLGGHGACGCLLVAGWQVESGWCVWVFRSVLSVSEGGRSLEAGWQAGSN
jgi:hypothetical protein